jgi:hypothetical protein
MDRVSLVAHHSACRYKAPASADNKQAFIQRLALCFSIKQKGEKQGIIRGVGSETINGLPRVSFPLKWRFFSTIIPMTPTFPASRVRTMAVMLVRFLARFCFAFVLAHLTSLLQAARVKQPVAAL